MTNRNQSGFTLYELLITIVIIGIVLTFGIPNFGVFTQNSRIASTANDMHSSFYLGRSEAARSKSNITIWLDNFRRSKWRYSTSRYQRKCPAPTSSH
jgi:type IV fimbrial biogenesis protein FimT